MKRYNIIAILMVYAMNIVHPCHAQLVEDVTIEKKDSVANIFQNRMLMSATNISTPVVIPPSPSAVALNRYVDYPVSISTGVPEISIPIFTIQEGDITIPISISYHASGIKVTDQSGAIALGWTLNAGGRVSRNVVGSADETKAVCSIPEKIDPSTNVGEQFLVDAEKGRNTEYDIFSYTLPNVSGKFFLKKNKEREVSLLTFEPIKIQHKIQSDASTSFSRALTSFDVVDQKGIQYRLGRSLNGRDEIEYTFNHSSSWLLTDVRSQANPGCNINFKYYQQSITEGLTVNTSQYISDFGYVIFNSPPYVDPNLNIPDKFFPSAVRRGNTIKLIEEIQFPSGKISFHTNENNLIDKIIVFDTNNNIIKQVVFKQSLFPGEKVARRHKLDEIYFQDGNGTNVERYSFEYNTRYTMPDFDSFEVDYWGYFNGKYSNTDLVPTQRIKSGDERLGAVVSMFDVGGANRNPNLEFTKTYILEKITQVSEQINRARKVLVCYLCNWKYNKFHPNLFYAH